MGSLHDWPRIVKAAMNMKLVLGSLLVLVASTAHGAAAVRECRAEIVASAAEAGQEVEARRQAMSDWLTRAAQNGPEWTRWQLAGNRRIGCVPVASGRFRCQAAGRPCRIRQVPP